MNILTVEFSFEGDSKYLTDDDNDIDVDYISQSSDAFILTYRNPTDTKDFIDINLTVGVEGMYEFDSTLNEQRLGKLYRSLSDDYTSKISLDMLRYILRGMLLSIDVLEADYNEILYEGEYILGNYSLTACLVASPSSKPHFLLYLNEKSSNSQPFSALKLSYVNPYKKICHMKIDFSDTWLGSSNIKSAADFPSNTFEYLVRSSKLKDDLASRYISEYVESASQAQYIRQLEAQLEDMKKKCDEKIAKIESVSVKLINSKKAKLRSLLNALEEAGVDTPDTVPLKLHQRVEIDDPEDTDDEGATNVMNPNSKKRKLAKGRIKPYKDDVIKKTKETYHGSENSDFDVELSSGTDVSDSSSPSKRRKSSQVQFQKRYVTTKKELKNALYVEDFKYGLVGKRDKLKGLNPAINVYSRPSDEDERLPTKTDNNIEKAFEDNRENEKIGNEKHENEEKHVEEEKQTQPQEKRQVKPNRAVLDMEADISTDEGTDVTEDSE